MRSKIIILILVSLLIVGCQGKDETKYSEELLQIFYSEEKVTLYYDGMAEYGHIITRSDVKKEGSQGIVTYNGKMNDGAGDEFGERTFTVQYTVEEDKVIETVRVNDYFNRKTKSLNSIIPNQIVLKLPLEVGNTWSYEVILEGETTPRTVTTTIYKVELIPDYPEKKVYHTETVIEGIEGYPGKKYFERRAFAPGFGMLYFENSISAYIDESGKEVEVPFTFGYALYGWEEGQGGEIKSIYDELPLYFKQRNIY
ncbi:hypothetical protein [Anaerobranca gottschalkii]|uniref:Uncharacterized protein n=1 Tax=Anaerobranca gottschalkii DSM 13577 TaxID=1120990 RepID=A0A1I0B0R9_9FIRM|nr:hypothetical protein [Anaerobranca gottschalkii]SET00316.1 hypothetical protein SAMN03080614_10303 [Anaerobranca gottschalkii DSM 13577]